MNTTDLKEWQGIIYKRWMLTEVFGVMVTLTAILISMNFTVKQK
jgi:hypothetical protein